MLQMTMENNCVVESTRRPVGVEKWKPLTWDQSTGETCWLETPRSRLLPRWLRPQAGYIGLRGCLGPVKQPSDRNCGAAYGPPAVPPYYWMATPLRGDCRRSGSQQRQPAQIGHAQRAIVQNAVQPGHRRRLPDHFAVPRSPPLESGKYPGLSRNLPAGADGRIAASGLQTHLCGGASRRFARRRGA